jgi:hypothetical protein
MNIVGFDSICGVFGQKFVHNDGPVRRRIIVVQNQKICFPQIWPFSSNLLS